MDNATKLTKSDTNLLSSPKASITALTKSAKEPLTGTGAGSPAGTFSKTEKILDFNVWSFSSNGKDEKEI